MTQKEFIEATAIKGRIEMLENALCRLEKIQLCEEERRYKPLLRFVNKLTRKNGEEKREAAVFLFDGVDTFGTNVPVEPELIGLLKTYYNAQLATARAEFEAVGREIQNEHL